ncbi:hypothetical protein GCM10025779_08750 [Arthrobacter cryoconiti]
MYAAYLRGDSAEIDSCLDPNVKIFDSEHANLISGFFELGVLREGRNSALPSTFAETQLTVTELLVCSASGALVASYWLQVDLTDLHGCPLDPELSRNTAVFVRDETALRIVHLHEDVWSGAQTSQA